MEPTCFASIEWDQCAIQPRLYVFPPLLIILYSSSGFGELINTYVAWETYLLAFTYARHAHTTRDFFGCFSTNFPVYLCKYYDSQAGLRNDVSPGSVASVKDPAAKNLRALIEYLDHDWILDAKWEELREMDAEDLREHICQLVDDLWDTWSDLKMTNYIASATVNGTQQIYGVEQAVRLVGVNQAAADNEVWPFYGVPDSTNALNTYLEKDRMLDTTFQPSSLDSYMTRVFKRRHGLLDPRTTKQRVVPLRMRNDKTASDGFSRRRLKRPRASMLPEDAVRLLARDNDAREQDKAPPPDDGDADAKTSSASVKPIAAAKKTPAKVPSSMWRSLTAIRRSRPNQKANNDLYYFKATDAKVKDDNIKTRVLMPKADSNLDLLLGQLRTGALVLTSKPVAMYAAGSNYIALDESDEVCEFLFAAAGVSKGDGTRDPSFATDVHMSADNVFAVRFATKLAAVFPKGKDAKNTLFQQKVTFSTESNGDAFDVPDRNTWPAVSQPPATADVAGSGQVLCMSIEKDSSLGTYPLLGQEVSSQILPSSRVIDLADNVYSRCWICLISSCQQGQDF